LRPLGATARRDRAFILRVCALVVGIASCGHARSVEPAGGEPGHVHPPYDPGASSAHKPAPVEGGATSGARSPTGPPLATSPAGLLKPGAARSIQERLVRAGALAPRTPTDELDGPTRTALARYQKSVGLPATGDPDGVTVQRLGLESEDVFVSAKKQRPLREVPEFFPRACASRPSSMPRP
jgi:hypothetical protein